MSHINQDFFSTPSSDMAYVLGLIVSDGCLSTKHQSKREFISIKSIDKDLLEDVKQAMDSEYGVYFAGKTKSGNDVWRIDISNPKIVADLKKLGVTERKTLVAKFPVELPTEFHADFARGLFDGDGHVGYYKYKNKGGANTSITILGTYDVLARFPHILGIKGSLKPYKTIWKFNITNHEELLKTYNVMYRDDNSLCLDRKKASFHEVFEWIELAISKPRYGTKKIALISELLTYGRRSAENRKLKKLAEEAKSANSASV